MNKTIVWTIKIGLVAGMYLVGFLLLPQLPDIVPTHWNATGVADGFSSKNVAVILTPSIALGLLILFAFLPKIDPKKEKYELFAKSWEILQVVMVLFFAYIHGVSLYAALNPDISMNSWVLSGMGVLFIILGNYMGKIKQNFFIGIKTPWTLSNEEVWNKTHRLGGWCFVIAGFMFLLEALFHVASTPIFIAAISISAILPILYSYILYKKLPR
jgi:uncharacterized membrane protein